MISGDPICIAPNTVSLIPSEEPAPYHVFIENIPFVMFSWALIVSLAHISPGICLGRLLFLEFLISLFRL